MNEQELETERARFQEFIKDAPEWDREAQIKKNQKTINWLRERQKEEISEEEKKLERNIIKLLVKFLNQIDCSSFNTSIA